MNIGTVYNWYQCCLGRRENVSSIVRYKNKKTGFVSVYESISHYDPVTKQSRPIRKYLGLEDPETAGTDARIRELEEKNRLLTSCLENMRDLIADALAAPAGAAQADK